MVGRAAERSHRQPLGIPAIRMAAGSLGTSKTTETFRDPQSGHFNDPIMVIRKGGAKGIALLAAADELRLFGLAAALPPDYFSMARSL